MNDETPNDDINPTDIQPGPSTDELEQGAQGDGTGAASAGDGAGDNEPKVTHTRVRIERSDGSRIWHVEATDDPETAERLAAGRGLGTIIRSEPMRAQEGQDGDDGGRE